MAQPLCPLDSPTASRILGLHWLQGATLFGCYFPLAALTAATRVTPRAWSQQELPLEKEQIDVAALTNARPVKNRIEPLQGITTCGQYTAERHLPPCSKETTRRHDLIKEKVPV